MAKYVHTFEGGHSWLIGKNGAKKCQVKPENDTPVFGFVRLTAYFPRTAIKNSDEIRRILIEL